MTREGVLIKTLTGKSFRVMDFLSVAKYLMLFLSVQSIDACE